MTRPDGASIRLPVLAPVLAVLIVCGYGFALWWLLRREAGWTFAALAALCGISLALRLVLTDGYPWGLFEDEPKFLGCAAQALAWPKIASESCIHIPNLLTVLFEAQLVPLLGATRWAMRSYSMITSVLAVPAAFAAARAMRLRVAPALVVAGLIAVLPWSIFYGRITLGGELLFHQALLVAGLARLVWMGGAVVDVLIAAFGLCLLLWDYWAGRSMMAMPVIAAVLAPGWRRLGCLAVIAIALAGWSPHLATGPVDAHVGFSLRPSVGAPSAGAFNEGLSADPVGFLRARTVTAVRTLLEPIAHEMVFTMRSVALHPAPLLVLAALGLLTGVRRGLFVLGGFVVGMLPGLLSGTLSISAHRIIMAYLFIALGAGSAVTIVPWPAVRRAAAALVFLLAAGWSVPLYFSDRFWPPEWRWNESAEMTAVAEAISKNPPAQAVLMRQLGFYGFASALPADTALLSLDNWMPRDHSATTYIFTMQAKALRPQYERFFPGRVQPVGRDSFLVSLEAADWSWVRQYGWTYVVYCGRAARTGNVPFLFSARVGIEGFGCDRPLTYEWRAHWHGPETEMTLDFTGIAAVIARGLDAYREGFEQTLRFVMPADSDVLVILTAPLGTAPVAVLREVAPAGLRVSAWELFTPLPPAPPISRPRRASAVGPAVHP